MLRLLFAILCLPVIALAQTEINSSIEKVTVFQKGAQVLRTGEIQLSAGNQSLVFTQLTQNLDANSISLQGHGNFTILSITHQNNFLTEESKNSTIQKLEEKQKDLQLRIERIQASEDALNAEKQMITANQKIGGESGTNVQQLQQAAAFFHSRIKEINLALIDIRTQKEEWQKEKKKVDQQLQTEKSAFREKTGQILVQVEVKANTKASFELTYLVNNAGWNTEYDARVRNLNSPVELTHKANIIQQSGEDWDNVELILSTGIPSAGGQVPSLNPLYVNFIQPLTYRKSNMNIKGGRQTSESMVMMEEQADLSSYQTFEVNDNLTQQEYSISRRQNIPSSPERATVVLRQLDIPAVYEYQVKPALDLSAFLVARIYNWDKYDLLSGSLSLYNGDTYVGKSHLNTNDPKDTLELSMGRDQNIAVSRERIKNVQESSFLGSNRIDVFAYKILVRNNKNTSVRISMEDRIPISQNEDIKVRIEDISNGNYDPEKGIVKWNFTLDTGTQKEFMLSYEVKYPGDKNINLH